MTLLLLGEPLLIITLCVYVTNERDPGLVKVTRIVCNIAVSYIWGLVECVGGVCTLCLFAISPPSMCMLLIPPK